MSGQSCYSDTPTPATELLAGALVKIEQGVDPQRLVDVAIAHRDKWAELAERVAAGERLDGRASIYTDESYAQARDRWAAYLDLLTGHLAAVEGGLG